MCLKIDLSQRKRPAVGFPNGWTFVIGKANNPTRKHLTKSGILDTDIVPGLNLFSPSNGRMLSAIRAKHEYPSLQHPPKIELQLYRLLGSRISDSMFDLAADSTRTVGTKVAIASQTDGWNIGNYVYCRWKNEEFYWAKIQCVWHVGSVAHFQVNLEHEKIICLQFLPCHSP